MNAKKVSIEDVAKRAKVSVTTVSRVINNVPTVSKKNRVKVEQAIASLKYKPNVSAQRLAKGLNDSIGFVMPGYPGIFHSYYAVELIRGIGHACEIKQFDLVFHITNGNNPINSNNVGGIIFADIIENRKQIESAVQSNIPCLIINNKVTDIDISYIAIDNIKGGEMVAEYLINLGHERIAIITGNMHTQAAAERFAGFKKKMLMEKKEFNNDYVCAGDYSRRSARQGTEQFLSLEKRPTAIFACSDEMALEVVSVVMENGLKVPDDISVVGFDDNPACLYGPLALTTVRQPLFKMAERSVQMLSDIILSKNSEAIHQVILEPQFIIRESTAAPSQ